MMFWNLGTAALVVSALALGGCATFTEPGAPDRSFKIDIDIQELEEEFKTKGSVTSFYDIKEADRTTGDRNRFISYRLTLMNIQYIKFIRRFSVEKAQLDTAADILIIGLDLAGTLAGGASTKAILAAISGGTSASRTSITKNFFHEQTVPVLITAMNAERKKALIPILDGTGKSLDGYPFARALSDLHLYYQAGTFIGALQSIQKDAGVKEGQADDEIKRLNVRPVSKGLQTRRIEAANFVKTLDQAKLDSLATALGAKTGEDALIEILRAISQAQKDNDFDVIAQQINVLFDKEI